MFKPTRFFTFFFLLFISTVAFCQSYEECSTAMQNPVNITTFPHTEVVYIDPSWTMDTDYLPNGLSGNNSTSYWAFTLDNTKKYDFSFLLQGGGVIDDNVSIGFGESCPLSNTEEIFFGLLDDIETTVECNSLNSTTTYIFVFAVDQGNEGEIHVIISDVTPENDECSNDNPDILTVDSGTTYCADGEYNYCGMPTTEDHQVFYKYTNLTGANLDLSLSFTADNSNGNPATDISMLALIDDCTSATVFPGTTDADYCNILGAGPQEICCIEDSETVIIVLGSEEGSGGDFSIVATENTESPIGNNDECTESLDITPTNTNEWWGVDVVLENACPEDFIVNAGCDFDIDPVVWFNFTTPSTGSLELYIQNILGSGYLTILENTIDCDNVTLLDGVGCLSGAGPFGPFEILPNQTYQIPFGGALPDLHFFEMQIAVSPTNDECENAIDLSFTGGVESTTIGATQGVNPYNSNACTDEDETNTVWFTYEVPEFDKGFGIELQPGDPNPIMGDINIVVFDEFGCIFSEAIGEVCTNAQNYLEDFSCVGPGFYTIRVASSNTNAGDFSIFIEPLDQVQDNDYCYSADLSLNPGLECVWMNTTANTVDACPEDNFLDPGNCGLSSGSVVWYEITAPVNAELLDLQINSGGGSTPFMALFPGNPSDCNDQSFVPGTTCYEGLFPSLEDLGQPVIPIIGGTTYLIAIGVTDPFGAMIDFGIKWISPPVNDICLAAIPLVGNTAMDGTTACASQPIPGEYNSPACTDEDELNTVFYTYEVPPTDKGFNITITAAAVDGLSGNINLVVFEDDPSGSCATGIGGVSVDDVCTSSAVLNEEFECVGPGTYVIRVSTSEINEGGFTIMISPQVIEQPNDYCDAPNVTSFNPPIENEWMMADANTANACPESFDLVPDCGFDDFPVVWYEITSPAIVESLDLQINGGGVNPFIGIFSYTTDCENIFPLVGSTCYSGIFSDLNAIGQPQIDVTPVTTYLIGVGSDDPTGFIIEIGIKWITTDIECPDGGFPGDSCDDEDACTIDDTIDEDCNCVGIFQDNDGDGTCDAEDVCSDGPEPGTACDDNDICTENDIINEDCLCIGTFVDSDGDGTCDAEDVCADGPEPGTACDDNDICTENDMINEDCLCIGTFVDSDGDGVCDAEDVCPDGPEPGMTCDDGDVCTIDDIVNEDCLCIGTFEDSDNDGTCDAEDVCENGPEPGTSCDDENVCTIDDVINEDCLCIGTFQDSDFDGTCDAEDICPDGPEPGTACDDGDDTTFNDQITPDCICEGSTDTLFCPGLGLYIGDACDDGDECTINDVVDEDCNCVGEYVDSDGDGTCDANDLCPDGPEPGTACDDNNTETSNDQINANCICIGEIDSTYCTDLDLYIGDNCDDMDSCTINDVVDMDCNCTGTFQDSDDDGVCDAEDVCPDGPEPGTACDDNNMETSNDQINADCICIGEIDSIYCADLDLYIGDNCDDMDSCTVNDVVDMDCNCTGTFQDSDGDGVCDAEDLCPDGPEPGTPCDDMNDESANDTINEDCECVGVIIPDYCAELDLFIGDTCDDDDNCTISDTVNDDCECVGVFQDSDDDTICDAEDNCPGTANEDQADNDEDGFGDVCDGDDDNDGILDIDDNCPFIPNEDQADEDGDGVGDACDSVDTKNQQLENVTLYPNPTTGFLHIESSLKLNYRIFNIQGKLVSKSNNSVDQIDISDLRSGLYFIELSDAQQTYGFNKIIKL